MSASVKLRGALAEDAPRTFAVFAAQDDIRVWASRVRYLIRNDLAWRVQSGKEPHEMKMTELYLAQLERELPITRKALERVPEGKNDWKPHPKSMLFGYLAALVASMPSWITMAIEQDSLDLGSGAAQKAVETNRELLAVFDKAAESARQALKKTNDDFLLTPWVLRHGDRELMKQPRYVVVGDVFTHRSHHRGQMTVYLRLNDIPVPSIYGPTADEQW
jgi:uncharacterized damage-inducible protein DinB